MVFCYWLFKNRKCDTAIYKKYIYIYSHSDNWNIFLRYIWASFTIPGLTVPNPLSDEGKNSISYYIKGVIFGPNLRGRGLFDSTANQMVRILELSGLSLDFWGEETCLTLNQSPMANDLANHFYVMKPP